MSTVLENSTIPSRHSNGEFRTTACRPAFEAFDPWRLTPFEWYMFDGGGQGSSMTFRIRLVFSGSIDRSSFAFAVSEAVERHPLLRAYVTGADDASLAWIPADDPQPFLDFGAIHDRVCFAGDENIDLRCETGLRIWVRSGGGRTEMHFQFHHACCDGIGAYRVLEDILCAYDRKVHGEDSQAELRPLEPARLRNRTQLNLDRPRHLENNRRDLFHPLRNAMGFFCRLPEGIDGRTRPLSCRGHSTTVSNFATHTFTAAETRDLRTLATKSGSSSNDLLMRDLFLALDEWNASREPNRRSGLLRIMLPVTQRTPEEDELFPACNRVSMVKIDRRRDALTDPDELLSGITNEIRQIRPLKRDLTFHRVAATIAAVPPLRWFMRRRAQRGYATTVLSQTGNVFARAKLPRRRGIVQAGDLTLEAIDGAPPVSPYTPVSFATIWYAKRLTITMSFEPSRLTQLKADALLAVYVRRICSSIDAGLNASTAEAA